MIISTKSVCGGTKRIRGTRITVSSILDALAYGMNISQIYKLFKKNGSVVSQKDIEEAVRFASNKNRV